jgi:hypothetical protein
MSDYWDYRSETGGGRLGFTIPQLTMAHTGIAFLVALLIFCNFIMYYAEVVQINIAEREWEKLGTETDKGQYLQSLGESAAQTIVISSLFLFASVNLYIAYFFIQTEQKTMARIFKTYGP